MFKERKSVHEVEEGKFLSPKFDENGLIPVITTDFKTKEILMHSYMNEESLKKLLKQKRLTTGADQDKAFGTKERQVDLCRRYNPYVLMTTKMQFGYLLILEMVRVAMWDITHVFIDLFHWMKKRSY